MNTEPIVFRQGEENGIVIEREGFEHSIFINQYQQAIYIFQRLWDQRLRFVPQGDVITPLWKYGVDNQFSNIIAFCGDRGEGKSSCMTSFATILTDDNVREKTQLTLEYPKDLKGDNIFPATSKLDWLGVIDPSFFDKEHNLLELLLGSMYAKVYENKTNKDRDNDWAFHRRKLMEQFEIVKNSISLLEPKERIYDSIGEMSDLAAGVQLKLEIQKLFKYYLDLVGKQCVLICIDDLDLNIKDGYQMSEMLRKYLINPYCIILVSVKIEQLIEIIATAHSKEIKDTKLDWSYCMTVAQKYVTKLLPRGNQVPMPSVEDFCEKELYIADYEGKIDAKEPAYVMKEKIVQMIFQKTGYVFYNTLHLSPIVPRNLRNLRHLLGMLYSLPDARDEYWDDVETGREVFKDYFFNTWTQQLTTDDANFAKRLEIYDDISTMNAFVVEYFSERVKNIRKSINIENAKSEEYWSLYDNIISKENTATNISYGDVMYVLWLIGGINLNADIQNLIFFIKTVYSMRLYACYNVISESKNALYPEVPDVTKTVTIHRADTLYEHVNQLQRLINGSYFTYPQGRLLPTSKRNDDFRDRVCIRREKLNVLFNDLLADPLAVHYEENLRLCEYLALCITRTTTYREHEKDLGLNRAAKIPTYLGKLSDSARFVMFDFLQPFYSLTNIEYAYRRFDDILMDDEKHGLYEMALACENSLLNKLYGREKLEDELNFVSHEHALISDAIIRISDVQMAIFEELLRTRDKQKDGDNAIFSAYDAIQKLQIKLYPLIRKGQKQEDSHKPHILKFNFLTELASLKNVRDRLNEILYLTDEEKNEATITNIRNAINMVLVWPISGKNIRALISDSSKLKKSKKASFTARLKHEFTDTVQYQKEDVMQKLETITSIYNQVMK